MQQNHCDGVLSNDWNTLLGQQISQYTAMSMSRSALVSRYLLILTTTVFIQTEMNLLQFTIKYLLFR